MVGPHQSVFIKGRWLHNNFMTVQGMAKKLHASKKEAVMLKLDITKAFDMVDSAFLMDVLQHMGFVIKWTSWIAGLLASSSTRVLLNGMERQGPSYGEVVNTRDVRVQALLGRSKSPTSRSPEAVEWIMCI